MIVQSARELLVRQGIENFTVARVAVVAKVSKPAVYYYFESKEELVFELALEVRRAELSVLQSAVAAAPNAAQKVASLLRARVEFYLDSPDSFRILHVWAPVLGLTARLEGDPTHSQADALLAELAEAMRVACPSDEVAFAHPRLVWSLAQGIVGSVAVGGTDATGRARALAQLADACRWVERCLRSGRS